MKLVDLARETGLKFFDPKYSVVTLNLGCEHKTYPVVASLHPKHNKEKVRTEGGRNGALSNLSS